MLIKRQNVKESMFVYLHDHKLSFTLDNGSFHFSRVIQNEKIVDHIIRQIVQFYECADEVWIPQESVGETLRSYGYSGQMTIVENGSEFSGAHCSPSARRRTRRMLFHDAADRASRTLTRSWGDIAEEVYDRYRHLVARKQVKVG